MSAVRDQLQQKACEKCGLRQDRLKYRKFGSLEWEASILGLGGAGLFPTNASALQDDPIRIIRYAIESGVNYLDLGYPFNMQRQRRAASLVGKALQDGYRERVKIAVTLPSHLIHSRMDFDFYLDRQLSWLQADSVDFCLFGLLNRENWPVLRSFGALNWADESMGQGRIENIGFSFHDHHQILRGVLAAYDQWTVCQFQFSYMDVDHDPGAFGIKYAAGKGLAVVIAESLKRGRLAKNPPDPVAAIWRAAREEDRLAEWGLRFVWNYPEVSTVVRDLGSVREIAENVAIADSAQPDSFTVQDELLISNVRDEYRKLKRIPCSSCRICMPCPEGIDVPRIFEIYNDAFLYDDMETARLIHQNEQHHADRCTGCRDCEKHCARQLDILDWLDRARQLLSGSK